MTEQILRDTELAASLRNLVFRAEKYDQSHAAHMQV